MKLGIVKEIRPSERRVAAAPSTVSKWVKAGWHVVVESGAGAGSSFPDHLYTEAGATVAVRAEDVWAAADVVVKVRPPTDLPGGGHVTLWLRIGDDRFARTVPEAELMSGESPLAALYATGHEVITQLRLLDDARA